MTWHTVKINLQLTITIPQRPVLHPTTEKASALSAAVNWVFRDGVGMACSLVFSSLAATSFDGNTKEWRLFADVINDVGLTLGKGATVTVRVKPSSPC